MRGIDISQNNASLNYKTLSRLGYEFAIIRDGYGWGNPGKRDNLLDAHYMGVKDVGMQVGYYHYIYSTDPSGAQQEALRSLENIGSKPVDLFVACDIEESAHVNLSDSILTDMVIAFSDVIRTAGYRPAVYSFASLLNRLQWERIPDDVIVWAAHWGVDKPDVNHKVDCWQHDVIGTTANANLKGSIPGAGGDIDVNILYNYSADESESESGSEIWKDRYNQLVEQITQLAENCIIGG